MDVDRLAAALRTQADWCRRLGSDLYVRLLEVAAADLEAGGPVARLLDGWTGHPNRQALALRMMGGVHHLALTGAAPALAAHYPTAGGTPGPGVEQAFLDVVAEAAGEIRPWLHRNLQTNEVNRSTVLLGGLLEIARRTGPPLALNEIGASAGLNLYLDRYHYDLGSRTWGDPASPVRLRSEWRGRLPPLTGRLDVVTRAGCDPHPIDPGDADQVARLRAFVWPDQPERLARLTAALELAAAEPDRVESTATVDWVAGALAAPRPGITTVILHSVVWHYIDRDEQADITAAIEEAGERADAAAPLAWLEMENMTDDGMAVRLRTWPAGDDAVIGRTHAHGAWVDWQL